MNHVVVTAKPNLTAMINAAWGNRFGGTLVQTVATIEESIRQLNADPLLQHMAVKDVDEWNATYPAFAEGKGSIMLGDNPPAAWEAQTLGEQINWLIRHADLFQTIEGLDAARRVLGMPIPYSALHDGQPVHAQQTPNFDGMPKLPRDAVYQHCREHHRPNLWAAVMTFRQEPGRMSWDALKDEFVPWVGQGWCTVQQLCEMQRGGKLEGVPSPFEVERALRRLDMPVLSPAVLAAP